MASAEEEGRRLFVGGLSVDTTDTAFRAHFASFFPVANAEVSITFPKLNYLTSLNLSNPLSFYNVLRKDIIGWVLCIMHVISISKTWVNLKITFIGEAI